MKLLKAMFVLAAITALVLASSAAVGGGGGLDVWFHIDEACRVELTPYAAYPDRLGARTFTLAVQNVDGVKVARRTLNGEVWWDVTLWCPGMAPTSQGTLYIPSWAPSGKVEFWFPLTNQPLGECGPWEVMDAP